MKILFGYSFLIVAIGTGILAIASAMAGCITVQKGRGLIGDAIGHSSFPGIVLAFMLFQTREPGILLLGSAFSGALAYWTIHVLTKYSPMEEDASLAISLSGFFGLGMVLKSYVTGNPKFTGASQSGLQNYIFGQAAFMLEKDILYIFIVSVIVLMFVILFYKEICIYLFDETYGQTVGINENIMDILLLVMMISLISVGLKVVGAILISSFLIIPAVTATLWTKQFYKTLIFSSVMGSICAVIGTYISTKYNGLSTGPTIVLCMGFIALLSLFFSPNGIFAVKRRREALK
ncbi:MAG: metal ABC transporter permease [Tissierellia bacterium]|nr:metal ABC transporter permease [Tissierellia bacterium]